jgi:hypothetical protein
MEKKNLDWGNLTFAYMPTDYSYVSWYKDGAWDEGTLTPDHTLTLSECAGIFHYCQEVFEGLKAYTTQDGRIVCFSPQLNAQRMADSADLWDISRSVLMVGEAGEEGYGYISQEKNSYGKQAQTVIFKNETGVATFERYISKKDKDFVLEASRKKAREGSDELGDACNMIMSELADHNGKMLVTDLNEELKAFDYSSYIIKKAKQELKRQKKICVRKDGYEGKNYICTL